MEEDTLTVNKAIGCINELQTEVSQLQEVSPASLLFVVPVQDELWMYLSKCEEKKDIDDDTKEKIQEVARAYVQLFLPEGLHLEPPPKKAAAVAAAVANVPLSAVINNNNNNNLDEEKEIESEIESGCTQKILLKTATAYRNATRDKLLELLQEQKKWNIKCVGVCMAHEFRTERRRVRDLMKVLTPLVMKELEKMYEKDIGEQQRGVQPKNKRETYEEKWIERAQRIVVKSMKNRVRKMDKNKIQRQLTITAWDWIYSKKVEWVEQTN